jgi:membrane protease YdiL (CAAX protease family)
LTSIPLEKLFISYITSQTAGYIGGFLLQSVAGVFLAWLTYQFGFSQVAGYNRLKSWQRVWLIWPLLLLILLQATNIFDPHMKFVNDPLKIIFFILVYLSTGLFEESLNRGFILPVLLRKWGNSRKGIYIAVIFSSALFGLSHINNYLYGRMTILACLNQLVYATIIGIFLAVCVLRIKSIWLAMLLHGFFDIVFSIEELTVGWEPVMQTATMSNIVGTLLLFTPFLLYALFILRKVKPGELSFGTPKA